MSLINKNEVLLNLNHWVTSFSMFYVTKVEVLYTEITSQVVLQKSTYTFELWIELATLFVQYFT